MRDFIRSSRCSNKNIPLSIRAGSVNLESVPQYFGMFKLILHYCRKTFRPFSIPQVCPSLSDPPQLRQDLVSQPAVGDGTGHFLCIHVVREPELNPARRGECL
jgi:hypothetical protein